MPKLARNLLTFGHVGKKNHKIFVDSLISLKFERMIANEWRENHVYVRIMTLYKLQYIYCLHTNTCTIATS